MTKVTYPLVPVRGFAVFPGQTVTFDVHKNSSLRGIETAMRESTPIVLGLRKDTPSNKMDVTALEEVVLKLRVLKIFKEDGNVRIMAEVLERQHILRFENTPDGFIAQVEPIAELPLDPDYEEMLCRELKDSFEQYAHDENLVPQAFVHMYASQNVGEITDIILANLPLEPQDKIPFIVEVDSAKRATYALALLEKEKRISAMRKSLHQEVGRSIGDMQKESFLREEMNLIQRELGDDPDDNSDAAIERFLDNPKIDERVKEHVENEYRRLGKFMPMSQEYSVVRDYLDRVLEVPWIPVTKPYAYNLAKTREKLDQSHYGMKRIKDRVVEYAAAKTHNPSLPCPVLCLVGPPGVGKTSVASAIADVLKRPYVRVSLGGVRDEAEIRGHRKTYVGAMPGRIVNALIQAKAPNPVMLLDEIDKMNADLRGDPTAALLEVLDSSINQEFRDSYLEMPVDLSDVFFITTANSLDGIPLPLYDRMEIIELESYSLDEKMEIAKHYLIPRQRKCYALSASQFKIRAGALKRIITDYTHEAGVRELERLIGSLCRKAVIRIVDDERSMLNVTEENLASLMDEPPMKDDEEKRAAEVGVVNGLAWTQLGGEMLVIETQILEGTGKLELTGQLGDVMKESAQIALSLVRGHQIEGIGEKFYKEHDIHIHIPAGATPKDGPSAGVTLTTAVYSAISGRKVRSDVAMTGEVSLRGRVLPIGGLKEKLLAAKRRGIKLVLVPKQNQVDVEKLSTDITKQLTIRYVEKVDEVLKAVLI